MPYKATAIKTAKISISKKNTNETNAENVA